MAKTARKGLQHLIRTANIAALVRPILRTSHRPRSWPTRSLLHPLCPRANPASLLSWNRWPRRNQRVSSRRLLTLCRRRQHRNYPESPARILVIALRHRRKRLGCPQGLLRPDVHLSDRRRRVRIPHQLGFQRRGAEAASPISYRRSAFSLWMVKFSPSFL